jgi:hypothetical protein
MILVGDNIVYQVLFSSTCNATLEKLELLELLTLEKAHKKKRKKEARISIG